MLTKRSLTATISGSALKSWVKSIEIETLEIATKLAELKLPSWSNEFEPFKVAQPKRDYNAMNRETTESDINLPACDGSPGQSQTRRRMDCRGWTNSSAGSSGSAAGSSWRWALASPMPFHLLFSHFFSMTTEIRRRYLQCWFLILYAAIAK